MTNETLQKRLERLLQVVQAARKEQKWYEGHRGPVSFENKRKAEKKLDELVNKELVLIKSGQAEIFDNG